MQSFPVHLPSQIYKRFQQIARRKHRSVDDEVVAALETALEYDTLTGIPIDVMDELKQLSFLDDEHLWRVAQQRVSEEKTVRIQILAEKQKAEGLTDSEQQEVLLLLQFANRTMLLRAEAAVLLKSRGFDISRLRQNI